MQRLGLTLCALLFFLVQKGGAQFIAANPTAQRMYAAIQSLSAEGKFNGVVVVKAGDSLLLESAFGFADKKMREPLTVKEPFMIASCSKTFPAVGILKLWQEGKLDIDKKLLDVLTDYPIYQGRRVSVRQCLNHSSGIPCYMNDRPVEYSAYRLLSWKPTVPQLFKKFANDPLNFKPGETFSYSNSNYAVLAKIIERTTGMPYEQYLNLNFLEPLRMDSTRFLSLHDRNSQTKAFRHGKKVKDIPVELAYGMGAMTSNGPDLMKWLDAIRDTQFLNPNIEKQMTDWGIDGYGLGWEISLPGEDDSHRFIVYHGGYFPGWNTTMAWLPSEDWRIVILSNYDESDMKAAFSLIQNCISANLNKGDWTPAMNKDEFQKIKSEKYYLSNPGNDIPCSSFKLAPSANRLVLSWDNGESWHLERLNQNEWADLSAQWYLYFEGENVFLEQPEIGVSYPLFKTKPVEK